VDLVVGLGAALIVTASRAIVVRQRAHVRPRSGIRSWPLGTIREVRLLSPRRGNGRIILRTGPHPWHAVSIFVAATQWSDGERVSAEIRKRARVARSIDIVADA
jgi:hypothetical protein